MLSLRMAAFRSVLASVVAAHLSGVAVASESGVDDARDMAERWIEDREWAVGWSREDGRLVIIESGSISQAPESPAFHEARAAAFESAFARARRSAAEFMAAEIEATASRATELVQIVGDPELAKAILGVSSDDAQRLSTDHRSLVEVAANASIIGLTPVQTFIGRHDQGGSVAMVVAWGPKYADAARGLAKGGRSDRSLTEWFDQQADEALSCAWGVRLVPASGGALRPVGFGIARSRPGMEEYAFDQADAEAIGRLGRLNGERVASQIASQSAAAYREGTGLPTEMSNSTAYESRVAASSQVEGLRLEQVGRRLVGADPITGDPLAVVAYTVGVDDAPLAAVSGAGRTVARGGAGRDDCPPVEDRMKPYVRSVTVSGSGRTESDAIASALMEAVRREGAVVKGDSRLEKRFAEAMEAVEGEIREKAVASTESETRTSTFANGFVHSYEVSGRGSVGELVEVQLCANIVRFDPSDPRFGLPPTLAVLPWDTDTVDVDGRGGRPRQYSTPLEEAMQRSMVRSRRFQVLDERNDAVLRDVRQQIARRAEQGLVDEIELVKMGRALTADFILCGELRSLKVSDATARNPSYRRAEATLDARLVNVADGRVVWSETISEVLDGRTLALARAGRLADGRPVEDEIEMTLDPASLALLRASRKLEQSLVAFVGTMPRPGAEPVAAPAKPREPRVLRVSLGRVTFESIPGLAVGDRYAVENPTRIDLGGGRTVEDWDRIAIVKVSQVGSDLSKAEIIDGESGEIVAGKSRLVRLPD